MRRTTSLLLSGCLLAMAIPASGDDARLPPLPTQTAPSYTYPAPMGSSVGGGAVPGDVAPSMMGDAAPGSYGNGDYGYGGPIVGTTPLGSGPLNPYRARQSNRETIDQFQSSSYWAAPQPFGPYGAPSYSEGLASAGGIHIRYPYFKYRAPWTYQGPAGISHTIEWGSVVP